MLILSRRLNECIVIDSRIIVKVVRVDGQIVKLGIQAPQDVPVHRQEIYDEIQRNNQEALTRMRMELPRLPKRISTEATPTPAIPTMPASPAVSVPPVETAPPVASSEPVSPAPADDPPAPADSPVTEPAAEKKTTRSRSTAGTAKTGSTKTKRSKNPS